MQNLSNDDDRPAQEIMPITKEGVRYTTPDAAVTAVIEAYHASIDAAYDVPWPMGSEVIALILEAPTKGWKAMRLRAGITRALKPYMPVKSVEITAERIKVLADNASDRAPSAISPNVRCILRQR